MRCSRPEVRSAPPKVLEPVGRHVGVLDRVLDVPVPEVVLQRPRVVAIVGEPEAAGMAKHVGDADILAASPIGLIGPPRSETNT